MLDLKILPATSAYLADAQGLAHQLELACEPAGDILEADKRQLYLLVSELGLGLQHGGEKAQNAVRVDFEAAAMRRRLQQGDTLLSKAMGKPKSEVSVLDATAGLGTDSLLLARHRGRVTMLERNPVVAALLADGIQRGQVSDFDDVQELCRQLTLQRVSALEYLTQCQCYDLIYLDPMFPERKKSALVKKQMQFFHRLVGGDNDADALLPLALEKAVYRVIVKRPKVAPFLAGIKPDLQVAGKASRFDVYAIRKLLS